MAIAMTAEDVLPFVAGLTMKERMRLLRLITEQHDVDDRAVYAVVPPGRDEFTSADEALGWEAKDWEGID